MSDAMQFLDKLIPDDVKDLIRPARQRSPEWYAIRRGRFTGSEIWKLMVEARDATAKKLGLPGETAMTYIRETLAQSITGITPDIHAPALQWGLDHEDDGKKEYMERTGAILVENDFAPFEDYGGGSVDGLIDRDGILEMKCPYTSEKHLENLILAAKKPNEAFMKAERRDLYWQVQNNMMCTGRKWAHFVSYDPRFPKHQQIAIIQINGVAKDQGALLAKIVRAKSIMDEMREELNAIAA